MPSFLSPDDTSFAPFQVILEGQAAARAGKPADANPYDIATPLGLRWLAGWTDATDEMQAGR
jgi:ribosome modulation factor